MVFGKQDTHVDREGRSLIRDVLDESGVPFTVCSSSQVSSSSRSWGMGELKKDSLSRYKRNTHSSVMNRVKGVGTPPSLVVYLAI